MKKMLPLIFTVAVALSATGCRSYRQNDVVAETYIHKYGVPVAKDDWKRNGKDGQVVTLKNNGVTISRTYDKGVLHGKSTYTFPNRTTVATIEMYENGQLVSKADNYASGITKVEQKFQGDQCVATLGWYEDGTPAFTEHYDSGLITTGEYRSPLNEIESKVAEGKGVRITHGNEGELLYKDTIEAGQMIERIAYFPSGEPASITPYKDGALHGTRLTFLQGGLPCTVEEWANGVQDGTTIVYQNGEKLSEMPYVKGKKEGVERKYLDGQILSEEISWKNDLMHGPRKIILDGGNNAKTEWYHEGEMVSRTNYERMNLIR